VRFKVWLLIVPVAAVAFVVGYLRRPHPSATVTYPADVASPTSRWEVLLRQAHVIEAQGSIGRLRPLNVGEA
jgi:hypothetical protein